MKVLAGDIGGTKTLLALLQVHGCAVTTLLERRYPSGDWPEFLPLLEDFLAALAADGLPAPAAGCIGVAGPVEDERVQVTNLPWALDASALSQRLSGRPVRLINDFTAVGYGIAALGAQDLETLQVGAERPRAVRAIIGAGTGLGHAILVWQHDHYEVLASEAGHSDFGPADALQLGLAEFLQHRLGRASWETVVSGPGLANIYAFLCERGPLQPSPTLAAAVAAGDPAAAVSELALTQSEPLASQALDLFIAAYGAQAGNFALGCLARGGLYVAGGIAPRIVSALRRGAFLRSFRAKGPMATLLATIPVHVVLNPRVGLLGAGLAAARLAGSGPTSA
jgi:glucokinase